MERYWYGSSYSTPLERLEPINQLQVYNLETYKRIAVILGHRGSVLSLTLSEDGHLLFSSAGDRFVNVWDTKTLLRVYSIYSMYDIGDIFCVSYSSALNTVYLGAQNTSIQVNTDLSLLKELG